MDGVITLTRNDVILYELIIMVLLLWLSGAFKKDEKRTG